MSCATLLTSCASTVVLAAVIFYFTVVAVDPEISLGQKLVALYLRPLLWWSGAPHTFNRERFERGNPRAPLVCGARGRVGDFEPAIN